MYKLSENTSFEKIPKKEIQKNNTEFIDNDFIDITKQIDRDMISLAEQLETLKELEDLISDEEQIWFKNSNLKLIVSLQDDIDYINIFDENRHKEIADKISKVFWDDDITKEITEILLPSNLIEIIPIWKITKLDKIKRLTWKLYERILSKLETSDIPKWAKEKIIKDLNEYKNTKNDWAKENIEWFIKTLYKRDKLINIEDVKYTEKTFEKIKKLEYLEKAEKWVYNLYYFEKKLNKYFGHLDLKNPKNPEEFKQTVTECIEEFKIWKENWLSKWINSSYFKDAEDEIVRKLKQWFDYQLWKDIKETNLNDFKKYL